jgi:hypothetical protein
MADISSAQVSVTTAPTLLVQADADGCRVFIHHSGAGSIWLGGADVTTTNGFNLANADGFIEISLPANAKLYARTTISTETAQVLYVGNN